MFRIGTIAVCLCLAAGPTLAAEAPAAPPTAGQPYLDRVLRMPDTAAAHVELAQWCEANGLPARARVHWQEALFRDPENRAARAALGFVRRGDRWVPAEEAGPPPTQSPPTDDTFQARQRAAREELLEVSRRLLIHSNEQAWAEGRRRVLMIRDPAAVEPVVRILGIGDEPTRVLAAEVLAQIPGEESLRHLATMAYADASEEVHRVAIEGLKRRDDSAGAIQPLATALARSKPPASLRAAHALGELGSMDAVPALIANLRTTEYRTVMVREIRMPPPISGLVIPYVAGARAVVAPGVVAYDPIIGYITPNGIRIPGYEQPQEVLVPQTVTEVVDQPAVLEALKRISGRDLGYNVTEWRKWYAEKQREPSAAAPQP